MSHSSDSPSVPTPYFEISHTDRYTRQNLIRKIEEQTKRRLLVYFANVGATDVDSGIDSSDIVLFQDLLYDFKKDDDVDLLLQTTGGDIDSAEKMVAMLRERAAGFRLIVTERAKSAGTLMAMAADEIVMSSVSELGPIDPQIMVETSDGRLVQRPAQSYLDGWEQIKKQSNEEGVLSPAYYPLLTQFDPALLDMCNKELRHSREFAEKWLRQYMLKDDPNKAQTIAQALSDVKTYSSHGIVIDRQEAEKLGLKVDYYDSDDPLWRLFWRLHLFYDQRCQNFGAIKFFESRRVSLELNKK